MEGVKSLDLSDCGDADVSLFVRGLVSVSVCA
jgi:hypothetical protein